jgi:hypothetical protein
MQLRIKGNIAVSESGFVFDPSTGDSYSINPIGVEIIQLMKKIQSEKEIINSIVERYQTEPKTVEKDLYDFCNLLVQHQLAERI